MNSEENFKNLLNDKLSEKEFVFEPADWESAKALIDKKRQRRRGLFFIFPTLLFILGGFGYFLMPENKTKSVEISKAERPINVIKASVNTNSNNVEKKIIATPKKIESNYHTNIVTNIPNKQKEAITSVPETKIQNTDPLVKTEPIKDALVPTIPISESAQTPVSASITIATNTKKDEGKSELLINNTIVQTPVIQNEELKKPTEIVQANDQIPLQIMMEEKTVNTISTTPTFNEVVKEKYAEIIPAKNEEQISNTISPSITIEQKPIVIDTVATNKAITESIINNTIVPTPSSFLFLEAGANYNLGWKNPGSVDANGFNTVFGVFMHTNIVHQFGFSFGAQYSSVRNLNFSQRTSRVTRYGLGEESIVTVITPATLHYIYLPLKITYQFKKSNVFSLGYTVGYLLNVDSKVNTYKEGFNYSESLTSYQTGGYTEGFAIFDSQITLGYRRKIYRNFWMNSEIFLGLTDVKNNTFFESKIFERNSGLKISLMYNIFKK